MLTLSQIIDNPSETVKALQKRNFKAVHLIDEVIALNDKKRTIRTALEEYQQQSNNSAKEIAILYKQNKVADAELIKEQTIIKKQKIKDLELNLSKIESDLTETLLKIPNLPHESVPPGSSPDDNQVVYTSGTHIKNEQAIPHWDILAQFHFIDFNLGNKITESGFPVYIGQAAKLQRALTSYFIDKALEAGYLEIVPPYLVNEASAYGTGQLPDKEGQMYLTQDQLYLIPTAEVPITNLLRDTILNENELPIKLVGHSHCFRREAGSYGKDVRGLNRVHEFEKVEIVQVVSPATSYQILDEMANHVALLLQELELPFRQLKLCGGDMGFTSALTYDFEVLALGQNKWLEVSSVSNFETFQSNRLKIRIKSDKKKNELAHTLNGSALALPRILAAILENNFQTNEIIVPKVLMPYTGFEKIYPQNSIFS